MKQENVIVTSCRELGANGPRGPGSFNYSYAIVIIVLSLCRRSTALPLHFGSFAHQCGCCGLSREEGIGKIDTIKVYVVSCFFIFLFLSLWGISTSRGLRERLVTSFFLFPLLESEGAKKKGPFSF